MPYDGMSACACAKECGAYLTGAKIQRVYQPLKDDIVIYFSNKEKGLLLSADASFARVYLTAGKYDNPQYPPSFCMLLRKYLIGGIIKRVYQVGFDRIINFEIESLDEAGDLIDLCLSAEIMGKHSNIILVNKKNQKILDAVKHVSGLKSSVRKIMPGFDYSLPPNEKINIFDDDISSAKDLISFKAEEPADKIVSDVFSGISKQFAQSYILSRYAAPFLTKPLDSDKCEELLKDFKNYVSEFTGCDDNYVYSDSRGAYRDFSHGEYLSLREYDKTRFDSFGEAAEEYYKAKTLKSGVHQKHYEVISKLETVLARENRKLEARKKEYAAAEDCEIYSITGNIILANMHAIQKGMTEFKAANFYAQSGEAEEIKIALKSEYTPSQNAQMYFKKYNKAKSAIKHLEELIEESENTVYELSSQLYFLSEAKSEAEADSVFAQLEAAGFVKKKKRDKITAQKKQPFGELYSSDGVKIIYGKNSKQNDELTFKNASKDDIWLHVKDIVGSHVIIKTAGAPCSDETLLCAAETAAYNSAAKTGDKIAVDYTFVKNVKKINGAAVGRVIFTDNKTLIVTPRDHTRDTNGNGNEK